MIKDSGNRREFDTGAVRDMQEGKGRCDLLPLMIVGGLLDAYSGGDYILLRIGRFMDDHNTDHLYRVLEVFATHAFAGSKETLILETAIHFEEGAKKYGENNWQKGLPPSCYIDSAVRHYLKWRRGDTDERHDRAFCWNLMCCIWEVEYHGN